MDDTISRSAAIDAVEHITSSMSICLNEDECHGMKRMQRQAVLELANMPPAQQWVSCKKRLPNRDEYIKNNGLFIVSDGNRSYSEWYDIYDKRRFGEPTMSGFRVDYAVTHWMPFPAP